MKWLALLFFVVLADGFDDIRNSKEDHRGYDNNDKYDDRKDISKLKVDLELIFNKYEDGALTFPPPTIVYGESGSRKFKEEYIQAQFHWSQGLSETVYHQGLAAGNNLIKAIGEKYDRLAYSIEKSSKNGSKNRDIEKNLGKLVKQLWTFLDLKPGNQKIEHRPLSQLPAKPIRIVSQTKNRTASDFFLHLPEFVDEDLLSIYKYMNGMFFRGLENTRKYYNIYQMEYRNEILNGPVLRAYCKYVGKVFKNCDYIEKCVSKETWESFRAAGIRIIEISEEWQEILARLENEEKSG